MRRDGDALDWLTSQRRARRLSSPSCVSVWTIRMPYFLTRFSYTPEAWAQLMEKPEDRREAVAEVVESVGGRLEGFWYAFGDHDGYALIEYPGNLEAASVAIAATASGTVQTSETIVLLTVEETLQALEKARQASFRAVGH